MENENHRKDDQNLNTTRKYNPKRRLWLIPVAIIGLPCLVLFVVGQFTPVLLVWIFKQAIASTRFAPPENFDSIEANIMTRNDMVYNEQGTLLDIYYPKNQPAPLPVIMFIHGGGFIGASKEHTRAYAITLANEGYVVANINFDLAPDHKYPVPVLQGNQALMYLRENISQVGGDIHRLFLAGNSAGSQIASQLAAILSNREFADRMGIQPSIENEQLRGVLLYDGAYDMQMVRSMRAPFRSLLYLELWAYTGVRRIESYDRIDELSTIYHVTPIIHGLPGGWRFRSI